MKRYKKVKEALHAGRNQLARANVEEPVIEAEILLRHTLDWGRPQLYADWDKEMPKEAWYSYSRLLDRRSKGEPGAYITGHREFYGLDFYVDHRVLIPRPESEALVELAIDYVTESCRPSSRVLIADIGTGSGALAVALVKNLPSATVYATDISREALEVADINIRRHDVEDKVSLLEGDLLDPLPQQVDVIVSNPPYVIREDCDALPIEIREHEPTIALDGGSDGLDVIHRLLNQIQSKLKSGGALFMEMGYDQGQRVKSLAEALFPRAQIGLAKDLSGIDRVLAVYLNRDAPITVSEQVERLVNASQ